MSDQTYRELTYDETEGLSFDELYLCQDTTGGWVRASSFPLVPDTRLQAIADAWNKANNRWPGVFYQDLALAAPKLVALLDALGMRDR